MLSISVTRLTTHPAIIHWTTSTNSGAGRSDWTSTGKEELSGLNTHCTCYVTSLVGGVIQRLLYPTVAIGVTGAAMWLTYPHNRKTIIDYCQKNWNEAWSKRWYTHTHTCKDDIIIDGIITQLTLISPSWYSGRCIWQISVKHKMTQFPSLGRTQNRLEWCSQNIPLSEGSHTYGNACSSRTLNMQTQRIQLICSGESMSWCMLQVSNIAKEYFMTSLVV